MKCIALIVCVMLATSAGAVDYKKNTITGPDSNTSTVINFTSSSSFGGTHSFANSDWSSFGMKDKSIDERIAAEESILNRLYFIRDVCTGLESEIKIQCEATDIREVVKQLADIMNTPLPLEVPEGQFIVEKSDVSGMPADQFLEAIAGVCGLELTYAKDKLVFKKVKTGDEEAGPSTGQGE